MLEQNASEWHKSSSLFNLLIFNKYKERMAVRNLAEPAAVRHIYDDIDKTLFQDQKDICLISMPRANYEDQLRYIDYFIQQDGGHITYDEITNEWNKEGSVTLMFMKR